MAIAREQHQPARLAAGQHVEQLRALGREIGPAFELVRLGDHLGRGDHDPEIRRLGELGLEPCPLLSAQHGLGRIVVGHIAAQRRAVLGPFGALEVGAEEARVEQDHLHPLAFRAGDRTVIDSVAGAHCIGGAPEGLEQLLAPAPHREAAAGVVEAEIMIVPGRHHRELRSETGEFGVRGLQGIGAAQALQPGIGVPAGIAIDIVADHQEQLGLLRRDLRPHVLRGVLVVAAAEGDAGERGRGRKRRVGPGLGHRHLLAQLGIVGREQLVGRQADADRGLPRRGVPGMIVSQQRRGGETGGGKGGSGEQRAAHRGTP